MGIGGLIEESLKRMTSKELITHLKDLLDEAEMDIVNIRIALWEMERRGKENGVSKS